jgi:tRNA-splicing ligase RtcB (3'-phosphate/5'-hydroxy nucleic acid ligase)
MWEVAMVESLLPPLHTWLVNPLQGDVREAIGRLRRAADVQHIAVMPDVHLAADVCIGVAVGTTHLIYPQAVGGDIGCGILAVPFDVTADYLADPVRLLAKFSHVVPSRRWNRNALPNLAAELVSATLSCPQLEATWRRQAALEFGTLGSGNHFAELQADGDNRLWLMVHTGSRAIGPAIRDHHLGQADAIGSGLRALDANSSKGRDYLHDVTVARSYAAANRRQIALSIGTLIASTLNVTLQWELAIMSDHNHVESEIHASRSLWVHRKGAMTAAEGEWGALPGSMGAASFHVRGRGCPEALRSSAHGAGRLMTRTAARQKISARELQRQMTGIWYDHRLVDQLRDEAPSAYKDIRAVARAQRELVKIARVLRPLLNYKGV